MKISNFPTFLLLLLVTLSVGFASCENDDDDDMIVADNDKTVAEFLQDNNQFSTLNAAIERAGLTSLLNDEDERLTLFAPNNAAFAASGLDLNAVSDTDLRTLLMYHVIQDNKIKRDDLTLADRYFSTAADSPTGRNYSIYLEKDDGKLIINQFTAISDSENDFDNGVIYELADVLNIPSIVDVINFDKKLNELETAVKAANLTDALSGKELTVFAPIDDAFDDDDDILEGLSTSQLSEILTYHVLNSEVDEETFENDQRYTTLNGEEIIIDIDLGVLRIEDARGEKTSIRIKNIQTTDGIVHIIDDLLLPAEY